MFDGTYISPIFIFIKFDIEKKNTSLSCCVSRLPVVLEGEMSWRERGRGFDHFRTSSPTTLFDKKTSLRYLLI